MTVTKVKRPAFLLTKITIRNEQDVVVARQRARTITELLGFDSKDQIGTATVVSELARNMFQYGRGGTVEFVYLVGENPQGLEVTLSDSGPGIANLQQILDGTYRSKTGMGVGIQGSRRLMDRFDVQTSASSGTIIKVVKHSSLRVRRLAESDVVQVVSALVSQAPASPYEEVDRQNRELLTTLDSLRAGRAQVEQLNRELSETNQGVVALYAELERAKVHAESASAAKSQFLANMSHEIRTPLGVIMGLSDILLAETADPKAATGESDDYLRIIKRNAEHLSVLINDVLDLSKIEADKLDLESIEFKLSDVLHDVVELLRLKADAKGVEFVLAEGSVLPERVVSDPTRLRQVLTNLVSNALKFTSRGRVELRIETVGQLVKGAPVALKFSVIDTGIGITVEHQAKLFEAFSQGDSSMTRRFGGTGLGLMLSRRLARAMGGELMLEKSEPGIGSVFCAKIVCGGFDGEFQSSEITGRKLELPVDNRLAGRLDGRVKSNVETNSASLPKALEGLSILLVEDSPDNQIMIQRFLRIAGAKVASAFDGAEGFTAAMASEFDVVIMDIQMPKVDGYEAIRRLREAGYERPVIALTAHALNGERERCLREGFTDYLTKPVDRALLVRALSRLASESRGLATSARV